MRKTNFPKPSNIEGYIFARSVDNRNASIVIGKIDYKGLMVYIGNHVLHTGNELYVLAVYAHVYIGIF